MPARIGNWAAAENPNADKTVKRSKKRFMGRNKLGFCKESKKTGLVFYPDVHFIAFPSEKWEKQRSFFIFV